MQKNAKHRAGVAIAIHLRARGRLDPDLHDVDLRLQRWGEWARDHYAARRLPVFPGEQPPAVRSAGRSLWTAEVVETDAPVVRLTWYLGTAVMAHYFTGSLAARLLIYRQLNHHIETLRGNRGGSHRHMLQLSTLAVFRNNLERARWSLRFALNENGRLAGPL